MTKLEADKTRLLKRNGELVSDLKGKEFDPNKEITQLREDLALEKQHIEKWRPQVDLAINKLNHLLPMCDEHNKVYPAFTPQWDEYCNKYEACGKEEDAA